MARKNWVKRELQNIIDYFEDSNKKIYKTTHMQKLYRGKQEVWALPSSLLFSDFTKKLLEETELQKIQLDFPQRREIRYVWGDVSDFRLAQSLKLGSYITHQSAAYLHGLIDVPPQDLFVNFEQPKRIQRGNLTQEAIDRAFQRPVRVTKNKAIYNDITIWLINGMYTDRYGVIEKNVEGEGKISVTNIARTLVDIAVRPVYSGGVSNVFAAYQKAKNKTTVEELSETLIKMGHIYPYHQVVGFYLEKASGFAKEPLEILKEIPMDFDFYLTHEMGETAYSKKWRLYYPVDLIRN